MRSFLIFMTATLLAGVLVTVPGPTRAQQTKDSAQGLAERLLDAVDGNNIEAVRSILAKASGRTLVALPVGLEAAGRAVERGYYEVAHHIIAVRNQQFQFENEALSIKNRIGESSLSLVPRKSSIPPNIATGANPRKGLVSQDPISRSGSASTPAIAEPPSPRPFEQNNESAPKPRPSISSPNPFDSSHTPDVRLPAAIPLNQQDNRSNRSSTSPAARVTKPPNLVRRVSPKISSEIVTQDQQALTQISGPINTLKPEKSGLFELIYSVYEKFAPWRDNPQIETATSDVRESAHDIGAPKMEEVKLSTPTEQEPPPESNNTVVKAPSHVDIFSSLTRLISSRDPPEDTSPTNDSVENEPAPSLNHKSTSSVPEKEPVDKLSAKAEIRGPGERLFTPKKDLSPDTEISGFINLIKKVIWSADSEQKITSKDLRVLPQNIASSLDNSPNHKSGNTQLEKRQRGYTPDIKIDTASSNAKSGLDKLESRPTADRTTDTTATGADATAQSLHFHAENKGNPFQEPTIITQSRAKSGTQSLNTVTERGTHNIAIKSFSNSKSREATGIPLNRDSLARQEVKHAKLSDSASSEIIRNLPILRIGTSLTLGRPINPKAVASERCFRKGRDPGWYCLEKAYWPRQLATATTDTTGRHRKVETIVRYENGKAVRVYSVIPSTSYKDILKYYTSLLGPPTKVLKGKLARLGNTPIANPSSIWTRYTKSGESETLEIRRFDNIRTMIASESVGLIRLYRKNSRPIFSYLSDTDLILHQIRNKSIN